VTGCVLVPGVGVHIGSVVPRVVGDSFSRSRNVGRNPFFFRSAKLALRQDEIVGIAMRYLGDSKCADEIALLAERKKIVDAIPVKG